ncbi:ferritin-like domain-containing protein [Candidatus Woesebacteria bacterium]|nr:ferritin-like domain-containing protein [Candidatus Woesebacteria bacterium]MCD8507435.1 ferritin-like domain-containing protein [Candidatus Woesebacteria bacterium]MCD8526874.1 ferritin-like domain-containing protein [Candidatus Woesebacteria bacterium]MCD8545788.1 ferritin-like domain-containing protein [Candidatus Woesebacteria bacterium]
MPISNLRQLFHHELADLYSAEQQITDALPKMIAQASDDKLKSALSEHLDVTNQQISRLDTIAEEIDYEMANVECVGMRGILDEGRKMLQEVNDSDTKDAAIISAAQRVEHYEIAAYGAAVAYAKQLNLGNVVDLLQQTLSEEKDADKSLTQLATGGFFSGGVNMDAAQ